MSKPAPRYQLGNARPGPSIWRVLAAWVALTLLLSCGSTPTHTVRLGTTTSEVNALLLVAQERGYFSAAGVEVDHTNYTSGVAAVNGLYAGEVDLATGSEFAFVGQVLDDQDIRAITVINRSAMEYLVARVDHGIESLDDLPGKTIGVPLGSRPEFALDRFLYFRGIAPSEVTLVDVPVGRSAEALAAGEVDAVATWQPYVDECRLQVGSGLVVWSVQQDQPSYTLVMSRGEWLAGHGLAVERFLEALVEAEKWVVANPETAQAFIQQEWDYDPSYVTSIWRDHAFALSLDQALLVAMEDQARWIIEREREGQTATPNLLSHLYLDGLESVKPEAVNVIH